MTPLEIGIMYTVAGSVLFILALKVFKVEYSIWEPIVACIAAGVCAAVIPSIGSGAGSLVAMLIVFKLANGSSWEDIWMPVIVTRIALVPVGMMFIA